MPSQTHSAAALRSVSLSRFQGCKEGNPTSVSCTCNFVVVVMSLADQTFPSAWNAALTISIYLSMSFMSFTSMSGRHLIAFEGKDFEVMQVPREKS